MPAGERSGEAIANYAHHAGYRGESFVLSRRNPPQRSLIIQSSGLLTFNGPKGDGT